VSIKKLILNPPGRRQRPFQTSFYPHLISLIFAGKLEKVKGSVSLSLGSDQRKTGE
jgi:hypothetical protein